jgi:hypothetical protein
VLAKTLHRCCGSCVSRVAGGAGCSHAVQPWAMLRCGGGPGVAPGAKTRGPLSHLASIVRFTVTRSMLRCNRVGNSFECFTVTDRVTGLERIGWSNEGASVRWLLPCAPVPCP